MITNTKSVPNILKLENFHAGDSVMFYVENVNNYVFDKCTLTFAGSDLYKFEYNDYIDNKIYFTLTSSETATINSNEYKLFLTFQKTDIFRKTDEIRNIQVLQNIETSTSFTNVLSYNKKMLEAITYILEGRVKDDYISYTIGNRSITKMSIESLIKLKDKFQDAVDHEENMKNGKNCATKIKIRWIS